MMRRVKSTNGKTLQYSLLNLVLDFSSHRNNDLACLFLHLDKILLFLAITCVYIMKYPTLLILFYKNASINICVQLVNTT
jgi:hypothetical protein